VKGYQISFTNTYKGGLCYYHHGDLARAPQDGDPARSPRAGSPQATAAAE